MRSIRIALPLVTVPALLAGPTDLGSSGAGAHRPDLSRSFGGADDTFVVLDGATGAVFQGAVR